MVAIKAYQAETFLKSQIAAPTAAGAAKAVLFYGSDPGMVSDRASKLARGIASTGTPPGEIIRIDELDLEHDADRLLVELQTIPMFSGRNVVRAAASRRVTAAMLKPLIEEDRLEGYLILEAGSLKPDDALRALFEKSPKTAAVACYPDDARDLDALIREVLTPYKLTIAPDAQRLLVSRLGADRALSRGEIEKLALYAYGKARIEEADVEVAVGDASEQSMDQIVLAALGGKAEAAVIAHDRALAAGESAQVIIMAAHRHIQRLHRVRLALDQGKSLDDAIRSLRPPLSMPQKGAVTALVQGWSLAKLNRALKRVADAQRLARTGTQAGSLDEDLISDNLILDLARLAASKARG
jgi:DNA polymerase III subunit delta